MNDYSHSDTLKDFLDDEVYPSLYRCLNSAFPEFGFIRKGNHWESSNREYTKGTWGVRPDRVMAYENTPFGFVVHGDTFITWLSYIAGGYSPRGEYFISAIRDLAERAGVTFPEREWTPEELKASEGYEQRFGLLEAFLT